MPDPVVLPSAPIILFEEYNDPKSGDYLAIVELASGKTKKIKAQYFGQAAPSTSYKWISTFDYPVDAIVEYQGKWYKSLQTPNEGQVPSSSPAYWQEVTKSAAGFVFWTPGVYTGEPIFVLYEIAPDQIEIYYLADATRPYLSADFETELAAGDWQIISEGQTPFKGVYISFAALTAAHPTANPGDYAFVDVAASAAQMYIWDATDSVWTVSTGTIVSDGSETVKGIFEEATDAELLAGTATGATGAKLVITPAKLKTLRDLTRTSASVSGGVLTLNLADAREKKFEVTTAQSSNFSIAFSNSANGEAWSVSIPITGVVVVTLPSSVVMEEDSPRWANGAKTITLTGGTASPHVLFFYRINSSIIELRATHKIHTS